MEASTATSAIAAGETLDYTAEIRLGVVMYGGVSLAIYINGVSNELYEMACATPRPGVSLDRHGEPGTREIYRRLAWLVGNPELRRHYSELIAADSVLRERGEPPRDVWDAAAAETFPQTRLVVDVIAGTSAGGINGVFLAKALANGEQFAALKDLWVNEGDIGLLLNDKRSYTTTLPPLADRSAKPASLLNSDRMYVKLRAAMEAMQPLAVSGTPYGRGASPLVDEIDLFVTTTDIAGAPVPLRLFDRVVYERRYKQSYQFSYPNGATLAGNDFDAANNAFLAFAARCTSSFPFAFEPMTLSAVTRLKADCGAGVGQWDAFFANLPRQEVAAQDHVHRAFGDGGYLDNKPFTYVVDTLSKRFAGVPLERKLVYVEPSPQQLDPDERPDPANPPDALSNSIAALTGIPRYETIREDLQAVLQRNRRIERVERIVRLGEADIERQADPFAGALKEDGRIPAWSSLKLSEMVAYYGLAFLPYRRLRVSAVTDGLADRLGERWGIDRDSDHQYALRALVRVWRESRFDEEADAHAERETVNAFLDQFDLDYRLRRLGFLLRKTDQVTRLVRQRLRGPVTPAADGNPSSLSESDAQIVESMRKYYDLLDPGLAAGSLEAALRALRALKAGLLDARVSLLRVLRESGRASAREATQDAGLHAQLLEVLSLLLGGRPADAPPPLLAGSAGERVPVLLDARWLRAASSSRTLQESVMYRARALFGAAAQAGKTTLQQALESSLFAMCVKPSARRPDDGNPEINRIAARAWSLLGKPELVAVWTAGGAGQPAFKAEVRVTEVVGDSGDAERDGIRMAALNTNEGSVLRRFIGQYYLRFDAFDQMSFPLYYDTGTGEPSTVEVVRISPADAASLIDEAHDPLHRRKLAGTALANFGAFLDRRWRLNDIMWGRLDGAERLLQALLPMSDEDTARVRKELITLAHGHILREALVGEGRRNLTDLLCQALEAIPGASTEQRLKSLLADLSLGDAPARERLGSMLVSLLSEQGLMEYVRVKREVDSEPDPKTTLESAARAVTITGRVLEGISKKKGAVTSAPRWLARLGLMLQGIVAVSLPGTLTHRWWTHGMKVLYSFEAVALVFALLLGSAGARTLALTALGVTLAVHLLSLVTGDLMRGGGWWFKVLVIIGAAILLALAVVGALNLLRVAGLSD